MAWVTARTDHAPHRSPWPSSQLKGSQRRAPVSRPRSQDCFTRHFPILDWGRTYSIQTLSNDLIAAVIVTIMLIPQSLAYALLAGLPPEAGIYASIAPILLYTVFGTSSGAWRSVRSQWCR